MTSSRSVALLPMCKPGAVASGEPWLKTWARLAAESLRKREDEFEAYYLSGYVVEQAYRAMCRWLDFTFAPVDMLDLGAGAGVFGQRAPLVFPGIHRTGVEIRPEMALFPDGRPRSRRHYEQLVIGDYLDPRLDLPTVDLVVSNCPFSRTIETIERGLGLLRPGGLLLLFARATFGYSAKGLTYLSQRRPLKHWPVPGRVSLRRGFGKTGRPLGGDIVGHVWWVFQRGHRGAAHLEWNTRPMPPLPSLFLSWAEVPGDELAVDPLPPELWP